MTSSRENYYRTVGCHVIKTSFVINKLVIKTETGTIEYLKTTNSNFKKKTNGDSIIISHGFGRRGYFCNKMLSDTKRFVLKTLRIAFRVLVLISLFVVPTFFI